MSSDSFLEEMLTFTYCGRDLIRNCAAGRGSLGASWSCVQHIGVNPHCLFLQSYIPGLRLCDFSSAFGAKLRHGRVSVCLEKITHVALLFVMGGATSGDGRDMGNIHHGIFKSVAVASGVGEGSMCNLSNSSLWQLVCRSGGLTSAFFASFG